MDRESFLKKYTGHFNDGQRAAVKAVDGQILLLAVPGSGKTTVLVTRLGYMLYVQGIAPENILTLTYTVAATKDMARRFESIFGGEFAGQVEFRTINGICARVIYQYGKKIGKAPFALLKDQKESARILTGILREHLSEYPTESDVKNAETLISYCKNMLLSDEEVEELGSDAGIPLLQIYRDYKAVLKENSLMDYDDQMVYAYRILNRTPELLQLYREKYRYICVDEAQDTSRIQHMIIDLLAGADGNLFMVGDEDQSIYGFRAAYPEALLNFKTNHPDAQVLVMDRNYRSNAKIVSAADAFIRHNEARHDKHMAAVRGTGSEINYIDLKSRSGQYGYLLKVADKCCREAAKDRQESAENMNASPGQRSETAVLYRNNESVLPLIDRLDRQGIPYRIRNADISFFTNRVVIDVTNILRFAEDPGNTELFMRFYFKCQTFLRKEQAEKMCEISRKRNIPVLEAAEHVNGLGGLVLGKCRGLATNLRAMIKETPSKAIFRIENPCGYGEYLERSGIDSNKLFILKQLAYTELTVGGFLGRLAYLQEMIRDKQPDYECPFILSTIHSSKGLEYDRVYLMDVCDGVLPDKVSFEKRSISLQEKRELEKKHLEEERRLFYVAITRAKDHLSIFRLADNPSKFIRELAPAAESASSGGAAFAKQSRTGRERSTGSEKNYEIRQNYLRKSGGRGIPVSSYELIIGERVESDRYGSGVVSDVEYDREETSGRSGRFCVEFDSGQEKMFAFPIAFMSGMRLASGDEVEIRRIH